MLSVASRSHSKHPDEKLIKLWNQFAPIGVEADRLADLCERSKTLKADCDRVHAQAQRIGRQIVATPANTIEGLIIKARCYQWCNGGWDETADQFNDASVVASLIRDLNALDTPQLHDAA